MTVRLYQSTDASAPSLTGTVGSLISVLDAVLVNGYGTTPAAGWGKAQTGVNLAAYRPATGNRLFLRIDDTVAQDARLLAYETMSDVNTGTGQFPSPSQLAGSTAGLALRKSNTADATVRPWVIIASSTAFYAFLAPTQTTTTTWYLASVSDSCGHMFFGDCISYVNGTDSYCTALIAPITTGGGSIGRLAAKSSNTGVSNTISAAVGNFVARAFTQAQGSIPIARTVPGDYSDAAVSGWTTNSTLPIYPDLCSGNMMLSNHDIIEQGSSCYLIRGRLPGSFAPLHQLAGQHGDIVAGTGAYAGRSWFVVTTANLTSVGRMWIELTNNW